MAFDELLVLARREFQDMPLTPAETKLLLAAPNGDVADCGPVKALPDRLHSLRMPTRQPFDREIRVKLVRWLCVNAQAVSLIDPKGMRVFGAQLRGVDLSFVSIPFALQFIRCQFSEEILLQNASCAALDVKGCRIEGLNCDGAHIRGDMNLGGGTFSRGGVRLLGARIDGDLNCRAGFFENPFRAGMPVSGKALSADGAVVGGNVFLTSGFRAIGETRLVGARIGGELDCHGGSFTNIRSPGTSASGIALIADNSDVGGVVNLSDGFEAMGEVSLVGAQIKLDLNCAGGVFENRAQDNSATAGVSLNASRAAVGGSIFLAMGFRAEGEVLLIAAQIGHDLNCIKGVFQNPAQVDLPTNGKALSGDRMVVKGAVNLSDGFVSKGQVRLLGSQIGGDLDCSAGTFDNSAVEGDLESGVALGVDGVVVNGNLFFREGFKASGVVTLSGTEIRQDLDCSGGTFSGALVMERTVVRNVFFWTGIVRPEGTTLDLGSASVTTLVDDMASWPKRGNLILDGFAYSHIQRGPRDAGTRLDWVSRQRTFSLQPYRQLSRVLSDSGDEDGASQVLVEMERIRRKNEGEWLSSPFLRGTYGYGYLPLRSFWALCALSGLGWVVYRRARLAGTMTPTDREAYDAFKSTGVAPGNYPRFFPSVFSLENSVPLVKFGQGDRWQPDPQPSITPSAQNWATRAGGFFASPRFLRWFLWAQILLGWVFATLFAAGVTGVIHK